MMRRTRGLKLLRQLRGASLRRILPASLALLALGAAVFVLFACYDLARLFSPRALAQLTPETMEGAYVADDIPYLHMVYARELTRREGQPDRVTGAQYVIKFDSEHYMGLSVHRDILARAEEMMDACNAFYNGWLSEDQIPVLRVEGTIRPLTGQALELYLAAAQGDGDVEAVMLPYCLDVNRLNGRPYAVTWAALAVSLLLAAAGLALGVPPLAEMLRDRHRARVAAVRLERSRAGVRRLLDEVPPVGGVRVRTDWLLLPRGSKSVLCRPWEVSWAYQTALNPRLHRGSAAAVVFRMADGKGKYTVPMAEEDAQVLLELLERRTPGIVRGYSKEKERAYRGDPTFANRWEAAWPGCTAKK